MHIHAYILIWDAHAYVYTWDTVLSHRRTGRYTPVKNGKINHAKKKALNFWLYVNVYQL